MEALRDAFFGADFEERERAAAPAKRARGDGGEAGPSSKKPKARAAAAREGRRCASSQADSVLCRTAD